MHFDKYALNQCEKAGKKLSALTRICKFMSLERRRTLMKSTLIESQFGYCLLVWIFCGGKSIIIIIIIIRTLRIVYNDNQSSFENLLRKDCSVSTHRRNIHSFAIEIHKIKNNMPTPIMSEFERSKLITIFNDWQIFLSIQ